MMSLICRALLLSLLLAATTPIYTYADGLTISDWQYLVGSIKQINDTRRDLDSTLDPRTATQYLSSLEQQLSGKVVSFTCDLNTKQITDTQVNSPGEPDEILARLADNNFQDVFINLEAEALSRILQNTTLKNDERDYVCQKIRYYQGLSECLASGGTCPNKPALAGNQIVVVKDTARLRQQLVKYLPFIVYSYQTNPALWLEAINSSEPRQAFDRLLQSVMQIYLQWIKANMLLASIERLPDFVISDLVKRGIPLEEIRTVQQKLRASQTNLEQISEQTLQDVVVSAPLAELKAYLPTVAMQARTVETVLEAYQREIEQTVKDLTAVLTDAHKNALKSVNGRLLSDAEADANQAVRDSIRDGINSLGSQIPAFIPLEPSATLRFNLFNSQSEDAVSIGIGFKGELVIVRDAPSVSNMALVDEKGNEVVPHSIEETIPLGITMERVKLTARDPYVWQLPDAQLLPFVRVDQGVLIAALRRLGLPEAIEFSNVGVTPSRTLQDIAINIDVTPPFSDTPTTVTLQVLQNGQLTLDDAAIRGFVEATIRDVYQPVINTWLAQYMSQIVLPGTPFTFATGTTEVEYLFDEHYVRVSTEFALVDSRDNSRTPWVTSFTMHRQKITSPVLDLPGPVSKRLVRYFESEIRNALPSDIVQHLSYLDFSVVNGKPIAKVYWDLRFSGCGINGSTEIDLFGNWTQEGERIIRDAASQVGDCAIQIAIQRTQEQLDQFLLNRELNLFGVLRTSISGIEAVDNRRRITITIPAQGDIPYMTIKGIMLDANPSGVAMSFRDAKVQGAAELEQLGQSLLKKYIPAPPESLEFRQTKLSPRGLTTVVTLKDTPLIGTVELGMLEVGAHGVSFSDNRDKVRALVKQVIVDKVNMLLVEEAVVLPEFGPMTVRGQPEVRYPDDQLEIWLKGEAVLYAGLALKIEVPIFPRLDLDRMAIDSDGIEATLKQALGGVGLNFGPLKITNITTPKRRAAVRFDVEIDFGFMKGNLTGVTLHRDGLDLAETITARVAGVIPLGQAISIKDPGLTYFIKSKGKLTLLGDLIIGPSEATAELVYFDSRLTLSARPIVFSFTGDIVAVNSLRLLLVKGEADFSVGLLTFEAKTNELLKKLIDINATGKADFRASTIESTVRNQMLGLDMASGSFFIDISGKPGKVKMNGAATIPLSRINIGIGSDLLLRNPSAEASFDFKVGSYRAAKADIKINRSIADLRFSVLGFNFTILAPSVDRITPDVVLRAILAVLDFDIESLLRSIENRDIVVSMFNGDGSRAQSGSGQDAGQDDANQNEEEGNNAAENDNNNQQAQIAPGGSPSHHGAGGNEPVELNCKKDGDYFNIEERYTRSGYTQLVASSIPNQFFDQLCSGSKFKWQTWSFVDAPSTPKFCNSLTGETGFGGIRYYQRDLNCGTLKRGKEYDGDIFETNISFSNSKWKAMKEAMDSGTLYKAWREASEIYNDARDQALRNQPLASYAELREINGADWPNVFKELSSGSFFGLVSPKVTVKVPARTELGGWWRNVTLFFNKADSDRNIYMLSSCRASAIPQYTARLRRGGYFYSPFVPPQAHPLDYWDEVPNMLENCEPRFEVLRPFSDLRDQAAVNTYLNRSNILAPLQQDILWLELHARRQLDNPDAVGPEPQRVASYSVAAEGGTNLSVEEVLYEPSDGPAELHILVVNNKSGDGRTQFFEQQSALFDLLRRNAGASFNQLVAKEIYRNYRLEEEANRGTYHLIGIYPIGHDDEPERLYCVDGNQVAGPVKLENASAVAYWRKSHMPAALSSVCEGSWMLASLGRDSEQSLAVTLLADNVQTDNITRLKLIVANPNNPNQALVETRTLTGVKQRFSARSLIAPENVIDSLIRPNDYYPAKTAVHPFALFRSTP
jgi:hypothetical protein